MSSSLLSFDLKNLRLPAWLSPGSRVDAPAAGLRVKYPPVSMDLGAGQMTLVRLARDRSRKWSLTSYHLSELPPDLLDTEFFRARIKAPDQYQSLVARALQNGGVRTPAISLVLPDHLARVALLAFEDLPRARKEMMDMVRWKMKKAVPFKVEDALVDYQVSPGHAGKGYSVLAVLIPASIIDEYEAVFAQQGIHPGLIDLSSFSLAHLYRSIAEADVAGGDFLLLNVSTAYFTLMIFRDGGLLFYRCKSFSFEGERGAGADADERLIRREVQASMLYYQERLSGRGLARVYMRLLEQDPERVAAMFDGAPLDSPPELIDASRVVGMPANLSAAEPGRSVQVLQRIAPAVGAALGRSAP